MAISRSLMNRQLQADGGIMQVAPREKFGLGSKLKKFVRKIIPNEVAEVAVKAAPFVAPFNPAVAAAMSGLGTFDQTGSIGQSLKGAGMNYAGGQAARYLGGAGFQGNPFAADGGAFRGGLEGFKGGKRRKNKNSKNDIGGGVLLDNSDTEVLHKERKNNKPSVVILTKDQAALIKSNILIYLERSITGTVSIEEEKPSLIVDKICQGFYIVFITTDARLMVVASIGARSESLNLMYICGKDFNAYYKDIFAMR